MTDLESIVQMKNMSRRRFFKKSARRLLYSDWVNQILAFVIVGAFVVGFNYFGTSVSLVIENLTHNIPLAGAFMCAFAFLSVVFVIPMLYGLVLFEIKAVRGEKNMISDVFSAFSDSELLLRSYNVFFRVFIISVLCFLPSFAVYFFGEFIYGEFVGALNFSIGGVDVASFSLNTLFVLLLYLGISLSCANFVGLYISVDRCDLTVAECFYTAKLCIYRSRGELGKTALSFFPLFVVSLFTMGFLFVMYTIPYMFITFVMFSKYLYDKNNFLMNSESTQLINQDFVNNPKGSI